MKGKFQIVGQNLVWQCEHETVLVQPWGLDGVRVQATVCGQIQNIPHALMLEPLPTYASRIAINGNGASFKNGKILVEMDEEGRLCFYRSSTGEMLLAETPGHFTLPAGAPLAGERKRVVPPGSQLLT